MDVRGILKKKLRWKSQPQQIGRGMCNTAANKVTVSSLLESKHWKTKGRECWAGVRPPTGPGSQVTWLETSEFCLMGCSLCRFLFPLSLCWSVLAVSLQVQALNSASKFEAEIKAEQDERKQAEEKRRLRQAAFRELKAAFST